MAACAANGAGQSVRSLRPNPTFPTRRKKPIATMLGYGKFPLHGVCRDGFAWRADAGRGLGRQVEFELADQKFLVGGEFGATAHDQGTAVGGREVHVEHLDGGQLVEHGAWRKAGSQWLEPRAQRDVQAIGQEGDEDMRLDALFELVIDWTQLQIVLEVLERRLDFDELNVESPQLGRITSGEIAAQQITTFAPACST